MRNIKRMIALGLTVAMIGCALPGSFGTVQAASTETSAATTAADAKEEKKEEEMTPEEKAEKEREELLKKTYEMPVQTNELTGWPQGPGTYGDAAIVMDAETGAVLYGKNIDKTEYPASITKVLTALLAFQYGKMDDKVTVSQDAIDCLKEGYAALGLEAGNVITLKDAIYAMLLASANEAAYCVGESIAKGQGEDYQWFIDEMNRKVEELGGVNSNFVNTNGMSDDKHVTCAWDMALIGRALYEYPEFFEICQTTEYTIPESDTVKEQNFYQKHQMLVPGAKEYFDIVKGGKTGYTTEAENTLITFAEKDGRKLVCVVLKTYVGHPYSDTKALLEYGFDNFENQDVTKLIKDQGVKGVSDIFVTLPKDVDAEDVSYQVEGKRVTCTYEENVVGMTDLEKEPEKSADFGTVQKEEKTGKTVSEGKEKKGISTLKIVGIAAVVVLILMFILWINLQIRRAKKRKRRREMRRKQMQERRQAEKQRNYDYRK